MTQLATLEVEQGETTIARVTGELDASNAMVVREGILDSISNQTRALVLDLRGTSYLDSSGVQLIFDLGDKLDSRRQRFHLLVEQDSFVAEVLKTVLVTDVAQVHTELAEALRAADSGERPPTEH